MFNAVTGRIPNMYRPAALAAGTALAAGGLLATAAPAQADTASTVVCTVVSEGVITPAAGAGAAEGSQTLAKTGTISCFDPAKGELVNGAATINIALSSANGKQTAAPSMKVTWDDGTTSTFKNSTDNGVDEDGEAGYETTGTVTADSTRYAGYTTAAIGTYNHFGKGLSVSHTAIALTKTS